MLAGVHPSSLILATLVGALLFSCSGDGDGPDNQCSPQTLCYDSANELDVVPEARFEGELPLPDAVAETLDEEDVPLVDEDVPEIVVNLEPGDVKRIKGKVVDEHGNPIPALFVQPCTYTEDVELCHKATTDDDGNWAVNFMPAKQDLIGIHVRFVTEEYTPTACYWEMADLNLVNNEIVFSAPFIIYDQGEAFASVDVGVSEPTVVDGSGVSFTVAADEWFPGIFEAVGVRIKRFPLDEYVPCFLDETDLPDALFSMAPDWVSFSTPGGVAATFENSEGLEAGATVSLFVLGSLDTQILPLDGAPVHLKTGDWYKLGTGTVSGDGSVITTDPGSGLPGIGWVGYKLQ